MAKTVKKTKKKTRKKEAAAAATTPTVDVAASKTDPRVDGLVELANQIGSFDLGDMADRFSKRLASNADVLMKTVVALRKAIEVKSRKDEAKAEQIRKYQQKIEKLQ